MHKECSICGHKTQVLRGLTGLIQLNVAWPSSLFAGIKKYVINNHKFYIEKCETYLMMIAWIMKTFVEM